MFNVYDKVWVMNNNRPQEKAVNKVIQYASFGKRHVKIEYALLSYLIAGDSSRGAIFQEEMVFATKEELIESLS